MVILTNCWKLSVDYLEGEKLLAAVVLVGAPLFNWALGTPPGSQGEHQRNIPLWITDPWTHGRKSILIVKYTEGIVHNTHQGRTLCLSFIPLGKGIPATPAPTCLFYLKKKTKLKTITIGNRNQVFKEIDWKCYNQESRRIRKKH